MNARCIVILTVNGTRDFNQFSSQNRFAKLEAGGPQKQQDRLKAFPPASAS